MIPSCDQLYCGGRLTPAPTIQKVEGGFPHSEIPGSKLVRSSPRLIAAYHVLHRLSAPRHPPNALKTLDRSHDRCPFFWESPLGQTQKTTRSKKQKDRSFGSFKPKDLMLAEHNRTGPALAANPATFPLNDVRYLPAPHDPEDQREGSKTCVFRMRVNHSKRASTHAGRRTMRGDRRWWSQSGSNRRPDACKATALPAELWPQSAIASVFGNRGEPQNGGPGTTRTSDLTLIRGAL